MERIDWNIAGYHVFEQKRANSKGATSFVIGVSSYPEFVTKKALFTSAGFEVREHNSGGLSIEVTDKDQLEKLQNFTNENHLKLTIPV